MTVNNKFERAQKVKVVHRICLEGIRKDMKDLKIVGVPDGIRTGNLSNTSKKLYCSGKLV